VIDMKQFFKKIWWLITGQFLNCEHCRRIIFFKYSSHYYLDYGGSDICKKCFDIVTKGGNK